MNCVVHPPESTRCGKNRSDAVVAESSSDGGVVVTTMSPRPLIVSRRPMTARSFAADCAGMVELEAIRRIPENGGVNAGKNSSMNRATWPDAGMVRDAAGPVDVPSNAVSWSVTAAAVSKVLVRAMPLLTAPVPLPARKLRRRSYRRGWPVDENSCCASKSARRDRSSARTRTHVENGPTPQACPA